jgi:predicted Zn-dependent protease
LNTKGLAAYAAGTMAQYSETVRNREGTGSGWAGMTHTDWSKIDVAALSARAMQKCVASANPRAIEPGRYTAILEPQVVGRFFFHMVHLLDRRQSERGATPFMGKTPGTTRIGERILDPRITISTDPMDIDGSYIPFDADGYPYRPVTWVEHGVLKELAYDIYYARSTLKTNTSLPNPLAYRMSGGDTTIEEMIATTTRGVLVSNTDIAYEVYARSNLISTVTRDGLWLIEHGKITHPVKNMEVIESPLFIGNRVEQLGKPERIFGTYNHGDTTGTHPPMAFGNVSIVVPPLKVRDFNFSALTGAV